MDKRAQTHTHVHAPKLWHLNKFTHVLIRSPAFHSFQQPITYRNFSFTIPLTCLCISRLIRGFVALHLTSQHCLFFYLKHSCVSLDQSVNQSARQSVHSQALHTGHRCPFTKMKKKEKHPGRNIQWREAKAAQQRRTECDSWIYLCSRDASVELRVRLTVVCGSCRTSERMRGREGGQQHCAVEMSHH